MPARTVDDLYEKLFSNEKVDPGVLVRMSVDLAELKANPAIRFGWWMRDSGRALAAVAGFVGVIAGIAYAVTAFLRMTGH